MQLVLLLLLLHLLLPVVLAGLAPNLILVVNPAVQYMAYEWLTQRHAALKRKRMGLSAAPPGSSSSRVKLGPAEVFLLGKRLVLTWVNSNTRCGQSAGRIAAVLCAHLGSL